VFERGFKTWCEKYSTDKRKELGLSAHAPLNTRELATNLGVRVMEPGGITGLTSESIQILLRNDGKTPSCWSAVTVVVGAKVLVILNSSHSLARQASDLTHELAHRILGHEAVEVDITEDGLMLLKSYDKKDEDEADWLSGCLLLPRHSLMAIKRQGVEHADAAIRYGVSAKMLTYRMAMTGMNR
jgi:Zn-dependent peptidase ImmA (M78 family)